MDKTTQENFFNTTLQMIGVVAKFPVIRVERESFLRSQFAESPYISHIIANGPQSVYTVESLRKKASGIIKSSTNKTSIASFVSGLPSNPVLMVAAGGTDVVQYFGFAINMAQQIAYLFGEDELFDGSDQISEEAKIRIIAYLGAMFGAAGAASLIANTSKIAGANLGKKVAAQALTKTTWYPLFKKVSAIIGQKVTKKTVEKTITKAVPVVGGIVSGGFTYITFRPMGNRLADTFVQNLKGEFADELELNPEFVATLNRANEQAEEIIDIEASD